jgi:cyclophilin family peptidyl-prolyl cis-trans isomerase
MTMTMRSGWLVLLATAAACHGAPAGAPDAAADAGAAKDALVRAIARAEDSRKTKDVPLEALTSHDVVLRRRSARALSRIADRASAEALAPALADDDRETVSWAAYGLGYACKGHEDAFVRALSARSASLQAVGGERPSDAGATGTRGASELEPEVAIARAIGRCGGPLAEPVLLGLLATRGRWSEPALLGLGDLATKHKLGPEAITALLEAASDRTGSLDLAFYGLGRAEPGPTFARRVADAAKIAIGRPGPSRILAVRALGRAGKEDPADSAAALARIVVDANGFDVGERAEAARALGGLGEGAESAIGGAIADLTPDAKDPIAIAELAGPRFHVLSTLLGGLAASASSAPKKAEPALGVLANLTPPTQPKPGFARRLAELRCSAALALARGAYDAEILQKCDAASSEPSERSRLTSLLRRPLARERVAAFRALAASEHLRIQEAAIEAIGGHAELGEAAAPLLADALGSKHAGLVATAAEVLNAHPGVALVLAESEKRAALDPHAPPPTAHPAQEVAPTVAKALEQALAATWPEDRFETRIALFEAAASVHLPKAAELASAACGDSNPAIREHAQKVLKTLGAPTTPCDAPPRNVAPARELAAPRTAPARVALSTDAGELAIVLEPELSPITATRIAALVESGFYKGVVVHRVVPGFVVQFGDPEGDGYGGSGTSLRCETSPVPFRPLDVGMALAGRDTGSSQLFVTLARTPHLEGDYTRVGHAEGDWSSVAQGDVILDARLEGH